MTTVLRQARQTRRAGLGAIMLAALVSASLLIFFLDDVLRQVRGQSEVIAVLPEARNVRRGAPVWIAGKRTGRVTGIEFMPNGADTTTRIALTLEVEAADLQHVAGSSHVRLTSDRLIGEPVVDIVPAAGRPVRAGDTLYARTIGSLDHVLATARTLRGSLDSLVAALHALEGTAPFLENMERLQHALSAVQTEFTALSLGLRSGAAARFLSDPAFTATLDRLAATAAGISAAFGAASARQRGGVAGVTEAFARLQRGAAAITAQAQALRSLPGGAGLLTRLRTDSALIAALRGVRTQLDSLIAEARRNPLRFVY